MMSCAIRQIPNENTYHWISEWMGDIQEGTWKRQKAFRASLEQIEARWKTDFQDGTRESQKALIDEAAVLLYCQMPLLLRKYYSWVPDAYNFFGAVFDSVYRKLGKFDPARGSFYNYCLSHVDLEAKTQVHKKIHMSLYEGSTKLREIGSDLELESGQRREDLLDNAFKICTYLFFTEKADRDDKARFREALSGFDGSCDLYWFCQELLEKTCKTKSVRRSHFQDEVSLDEELTDDGFTYGDIAASDQKSLSVEDRMAIRLKIEGVMHRTAVAINQQASKLPTWEEDLKASKTGQQVRAKKKLRAAKMVFSEQLRIAANLLPDLSWTQEIKRAKYDSYYQYLDECGCHDTKIPAGRYIEFIEKEFGERESDPGVSQKRKAFLDTYFSSYEDC